MTEPPSPNILVIGIDDDTLNTYVKWANWSRSFHAQVLEQQIFKGKAELVTVYRLLGCT